MSLFRSLFDAITGAPPRIPAAERALVEAEAQSEDTPRNILVHDTSIADVDRQQRELRWHTNASSSAAGDAAESGPRQSTEPPGGPGAGHPDVETEILRRKGRDYLRLTIPLGDPPSPAPGPQTPVVADPPRTAQPRSAAVASADCGAGRSTSDPDRPLAEVFFDVAETLSGLSIHPADSPAWQAFADYARDVLIPEARDIAAQFEALDC